MCVCAGVTVKAEVPEQPLDQDSTGEWGWGREPRGG